MSAVIPIFAPEHSIKSVTIFKSTNQAEVVRTFDVELKPGQTKIEITGLPSVLDTESVRVTGLGSGSGSPLRLYDVVCTISSKDTVPVIGAYANLSSLSTQAFLANVSTSSMDPAERIRLLKARLETLQAEKDIREHEAELLLSYAKTLSGEHISPEKMSAFLSTFVESGQKNLVGVRDIEERMVQVQRWIEIEEQQLEKKKGTARARVDVLVGNGEKDDGENRKIELKLTYIVSKASWEPTYELHAHTSPSTGQPSSQVTLHYRAFIVQATGEDWTNAALTLSAGSSAGRGFGFTTNMPILNGVKIKPRSNPFRNNLFGTRPPVAAPTPATFGGGPNANTTAFGSSNSLFGGQQHTSGFGAFGSAFGANGSQPNVIQQQLQQQQLVQPQQVQQLQQQQQQQQPSADLLSDDFEHVTLRSDENASNQATTVAGLGGTDIGDVPLSQTQTAVTETPVAISYSVEGLVSIPSDGVKHQVGVAKLPFGSEKEKDESVKIEYGVVPRSDARVYLECRVKNTSEYRLLPGPVAVILNDIYVARTNIKLVNPNDVFACTLGSDTTTLVTYTNSSKSTTSSLGSFAQSYKVTTYTTTVTLWNRHTFDLSGIRVRDAVPVWTPAANEWGKDHDQVSVVLRKPEGLADAKEGQVVEGVKDKDGKERKNVRVVWKKEKEGLFEWKVDVPAGKTERLVLEWEVKAPADLALIAEAVTK